MVNTESRPEPFVTVASNGPHSLVLDAPVSKGGQGVGFGPHELLEAAIAACINMAVRMCAASNQIPLESVTTSVRIVRPDSQATKFEYSVTLAGPIDDAQRESLLQAAATCPVRKTLSCALEFEHVQS